MLKRVGLFVVHFVSVAVMVVLLTFFLSPSGYSFNDQKPLKTDSKLLSQTLKTQKNQSKNTSANSTLDQTASIKQNTEQKQKLNIKVSLSGLKNNKIRKAVKNNLSLIQYKQYASQSKSIMKLMFGKSKKEIKKTLIPYGYFNPNIKTHIKHNQNTWRINFNVSPGKPMIIKKIDIDITGQAQNNADFDSLKNKLPIKTGERLVQKDYMDAKNQLSEMAFKHGYFNADFIKSQIKVNRQQNVCSIHIKFNSQNQYQFGRIKITQNGYQFDIDFIKRFLTFKQGQAYSQQKINETLSRLQSSIYFNAVEIQPDLKNKKQSTNQMPINIELTAEKSTTYTIGGGFGTFTGIRASASAIRRHITDYGHYAKFKTEISQVTSTFKAEYIIPGDKPSKEHWALTAQQNLLSLIPYQARQTSYGLSNRNKTGVFESTIKLQQHYISYQLDNSSSTRKAKYLLPSWQLKFKYMWENGFWDSGVMIHNKLQLSIKSILSTNTFYRNLTNLRISIPLMPDHNRLFLSTNTGFMAVDDFSNLAPSFRFYAGGMTNLLGYASLSRGPKNANGDLRGGQYLLTALARIEQRVYGNFSVMVYGNAGNAANSLNFADVPLLRAVGIGASYKSPLGPIQFFLTKDITPGVNESFRFDLSIGVFF